MRCQFCQVGLIGYGNCCRKCAAKLRFNTVDDVFIKEKAQMWEPTEIKRFLPFRGQTWTITKCTDGLWRDSYGCVYSVFERENATDLATVCGVSPLALPQDHPANDGCKAHDHAYSSTAYQLFHTRAEADEMLQSHLEQLGYSFLGRVFKKLANWFGGSFWENNKTR